MREGAGVQRGHSAPAARTMVERRDHQLLRPDDSLALRGVEGEPGVGWKEAVECALLQYVLLVQAERSRVREGEAGQVDKEGTSV